MLREGFTVKARAPDCRAPDDLETHRISSDLWLSAPSVPSSWLPGSSFRYSFPQPLIRALLCYDLRRAGMKVLGEESHWSSAFTCGFMDFTQNSMVFYIRISVGFLAWMAVLRNNINEAPSSQAHITMLMF